MCILFLHVDPNPADGQFRLIAATNRDESYRRPALPAVKNNETNVIGGIDMEKGREGGMWLGFSSNKQKHGKHIHCFSALLNLSGETTKNASGRGSIVKDYLEGPKDFPQYVKRLGENIFNGFNLVGVELSENDLKTFHYSNNPKIDCVYSGKHTLAFGNNPPYNPSQKVLRGRRKFIEIIEKNFDEKSLEEELIKLLKDTTRNLPDLELQKKYPKDYESLSSIYVEMGQKGYGTRHFFVIGHTV
ncbi:transport and Golgi organization protein 2 isoform X2 [Leptinotarsa decemlineata]|uniref:transport and Golgi organization protein 2 isoform X2 n=1 Tax=Leptinotarsa decemlineata TaxID=7539 RepID=UPI003D304EB7